MSKILITGYITPKLMYITKIIITTYMLTRKIYNKIYNGMLYIKSRLIGIPN